MMPKADSAKAAKAAKGVNGYENGTIFKKVQNPWRHRRHRRFSR